MCTVSVKVNEAAIRDINPHLDTPAASAKKYPYDRDMTVEELYAAIVEDVKEIYAK